MNHDPREMADCLFECLKEARLEKYYRNFVNGGLRHCEALLKLSMQDYPRYGVVLMEDRLRLFKLIQIVKSVQSEGLVCRHGHAKETEQDRNVLHNIRNHQKKAPTLKDNHQHHHHGNLVRPIQVVQPPQVAVQRLQQNNPLNAPQHVARKSVTQVSYKPHSDSPIFHCRKTLKFTDSDVDSEEEEEESEPVPHASQIILQENHVQRTETRNNEGDLQKANQIIEEPKVTQNVTAVSQYLQNVVHYHGTSSVGSSVFQQQKDSNSNHIQMQQHNEKHAEEIIINSGRDTSNGIDVNRDLLENKLIIDRKDCSQSDDVLLNSKGSSLVKEEEIPMKVVKETTVHVNKHFDKQTDVHSGLNVNIINGAKESDYFINNRANDRLTISTEKEDSNFTSNTKRSPKAFYIDASVTEETTDSALNRNSNIQPLPSQALTNASQTRDQVSTQSSQVQSQLFGIQQPQGHIMYRPFSTLEEQQRRMMHSNNNHPMQQQQPQPYPKAFQFKNFQPSSVITGGQHSYFPTHTTQDFPSGNGTHKTAHVEKVYHNTGYNYGLPSSVQSEQQTQNKEIVVSSSSAATKAGSINFTSSDSTKSNTRNSTNGRGNNIFGNAKIRVCVRKRPMLNKEAKRGESDIIKTQDSDTIVVEESKVTVSLAKFMQQHIFKFDEVFGASCNNENVYSRTVKPLVQCVFNRGSATCFAFGQTGSGKSYTLLGNETVPGLYQLAAKDIFSFIEKLKGGSAGHLHLWASYYEIYCSHLFDLLNKRKRLHVRENNRQKVCIAGLMETEVHSVKGLVEVVQYGNAVRVTGVSGANSQSSRSHAILQLEVRDNKDVKMGRMSFIDLAGSERATDMTETSDRQTRIEGAEINQSLLALKECIRSLDQESRHTPYRQSKLTHILRDSFTGNSQTVMIANVAPCMSSCVHTLNTLKYADRVKELKKSQNNNISPTKSTKVKQPTPKLQNVQHSNIRSNKTPGSGQTASNNRHQTAFTRKYTPTTNEKPQLPQPFMNNEVKSGIKVGHEEHLLNDVETPNKGMPALFLGGQTGVQFASTPKMKGSPPEVGQMTSPFDVSRILREESDTPIRGHKIIKHDEKQTNKCTPDSSEGMIGPRKLDFDVDDEDEEIINISKVQERDNIIESTSQVNNVVHKKQTAVSKHSPSSFGQNNAKKIYIGTDKVSELIQAQKERSNSGDNNGVEMTGNEHYFNSEIEHRRPKSSREHYDRTRERSQSPGTYRQRSKSSGHVLEANSNRMEDQVTIQRRSRSIEKSSGDHGDGVRRKSENSGDKYVTPDNRHDSQHVNSQHSQSSKFSSSSRSRSGSNDRFSSSSYPIKSHDEIMAEHKEVLDHLDSLLDRAKAAINDSPISSSKSRVENSKQNINKGYHKNGSNKTPDSSDKPLVGILKKTPHAEGELMQHNDIDEFFVESEVDKVRHSDPLVQKYPRSSQNNINIEYQHHSYSETKALRQQITKAQSTPSVNYMTNGPIGYQNERIQQVKQFSDHAKRSMANHQLESDMVIEYYPDDENIREDSPRLPSNKISMPKPRHTFGPKENGIPPERPRPEGEFQRSNSQTSDRESERSASRNMSWHDILSNSNSEPKSKDSSFNDRHQRISNRTSRDGSLEYFEDDKQGFKSKAMIKDIDTVVIETNMIPPETGRLTVDSGIGTHRSHDMDNDFVSSHSRGSHHSNDVHSHSSVETLDDLSLPGANAQDNLVPSAQVAELNQSSQLNTSIKVKYVSSKKATSRLSLLQDPDSSVVPPLKLNFDDDDSDEYILSSSKRAKDDKKSIISSSRNAYSAREMGQGSKHLAVDSTKSARDYESVGFKPTAVSSSSATSHLINNGIESQIPTLPVHQGSAFTVVTESNVHQDVIHGNKTQITSSYNTEFSQKGKSPPSESKSNSVGNVNFSPIQSFPITPRVGSLIAVPSVIGKNTAQEVHHANHTPPSGLVDYLKSEKSKLSSSKSQPDISGAIATTLSRGENIERMKPSFSCQDIQNVDKSSRNAAMLQNPQPTQQQRIRYEGIGDGQRFNLEQQQQGQQSGSSVRYDDTSNTLKLVHRVTPNGAHGDELRRIQMQQEQAVAQTGSANNSNTPGATSVGSTHKSIKQAQEMLMMNHEEQLSQMTSLCKQEMKLLMSARVNQKSFPEYVRALEEILSDKGRAILLLKSKIDEYVNIANKK